MAPECVLDRLLSVPVLVLCAALASGGCAGCETRGGDALRLLPAGADAVVVPRVETLRADLASFLAGIEGASGVFDLIEARYGVRPSSDEGLRAVAIDPDTALVFFEHAGFLVLAVGVTNARRFLDTVADRVLRMSGAALQSTGTEGGPDGAAALGSGARIAWGVTEDQVGLLVWAPGQADVAARWIEVASGPATRQAPPAEASTPGVDLWATAHRPPPVPSGLGPAGPLLAGYTQGLTRWVGTLALAEDRLRLEVNGTWTAEGGLPVHWFADGIEGSRLADSLPKSLTAYARLMANPEGLTRMPPWLRAKILPARWPGLWNHVLPAPDSLLAHLQGEVAVALLGLDEQVTVDHMSRWVESPSLVFQGLHVALALRVTDPAGVAGLLAPVAPFMGVLGWKVDAVEAGPWRGFALRGGKPRQTWSVLHRGDVLVLMSGQGEVERFRAAAEGSALSLAQSRPDVPPAPTVDLHFDLTRITRELSRKGAPPYFLKMLSDLHAVDGALGVRADGVDLSLDISL